jgi:galactose-1-phosphate uridylyltransferase
VIKPLFVYNTLADGSLRILNPVVGEEVWTVPGRAQRPVTNDPRRLPEPLDPSLDLEAVCHFCPKNSEHTPAEKSRVVRDGAGFKVLEKQTAEQALARPALFRRVPNLFEIVPMEFWKRNYGFRLSALQRQWKDAYLSTPKGRAHVLGVIQEKLEHGGKAPEDIAALSEDAKLEMADAFFGGSHDLIVSGRHYKEGATTQADLLHSGSLTREEHFLFLSFTLNAVSEIHRENPYVKHVAVYQNWLAQAGASFDHLHKQVLGVDTWGAGIHRRLEVLRRYPPFYNQVLLAALKVRGLVLAENAVAVAVVEPGHIYPCLAVYSKSAASDPAALSAEELKGFSDLLRAVHAAAGPRVPCNEEWYFRPRGADVGMPFHVLVKWRVNTPAGFEGGSEIHINPLFPEQVRDRLLPALKDLQAAGELPGASVGEECACEEGCLRYDKAALKRP